MKKSWVAVLVFAFAAMPVMAQDDQASAVAKPGKMLIGADGVRLGSIYRITSNGSPQLIVNGKLLTIPASTLSVVDGELKTTLSKKELSKSH